MMYQEQSEGASLGFAVKPMLCNLCSTVRKSFGAFVGGSTEINEAHRQNLPENVDVGNYSVPLINPSEIFSNMCVCLNPVS
jgi:hypothetical protein